MSGTGFTEFVVEAAALAWLEDESRILGSLRDALLPKLNSAQLPMKNARWLVETG